MQNAELWIGKKKDGIIEYCNKNNIKYIIAEMDSKPGINYDTELIVRANMQDDVLHIVVGKFKLNV